MRLRVTLRNITPVVTYVRRTLDFGTYAYTVYTAAADV